MPLSADLRDELAAIAPGSDCDRLAELSGLFHVAGSVHLRGRGNVAVHLDLASSAAARRAFALLRAFDDRFGSGDSSQPWVLIAHTVKGKGVSFMENVMEWHGNLISREQYEIAIRELDDRTGSEYPWQ